MEERKYRTDWESWANWAPKILKSLSNFQALLFITQIHFPFRRLKKNWEKRVVEKERVKVRVVDGCEKRSVSVTALSERFLNEDEEAKAKWENEIQHTRNEC